MTEAAHAVLLALVTLSELASALVVASAVARALVLHARTLLTPNGTMHMGPIRLKLGQGLVLAVEIMVGADILRTALSPTWNDLLRLAALIALRTILSMTLIHEMRLIGEHLGIMEE